MIHKYKNFLDKEELQGIKEYMELLFFRARTTRTKPDPMVKDALAIYGDPVTDYFLHTKKTLVEYLVVNITLSTIEIPKY